MEQKYGDCIRCGFCCISDPCGLATQTPCEHLSSVDGVHSCAHYPFEHLGSFERFCLEPGQGCGYGGENPLYITLWKKLKEK